MPVFAGDTVLLAAGGGEERANGVSRLLPASGGYLPQKVKREFELAIIICFRAFSFCADSHFSLRHSFCWNNFLQHFLFLSLLEFVY